jgi:dTDP-4-amino-4,6-dideoxygalactose transaminase
MSDAVPFVDLGWQHDQIADEVADGFDRVLGATAFVKGPDVAAFEEEFAAFCGVDHCVGVANGTDAVELALRAVGVGPGDEVVVPANTFIASAEAIVRLGARPVLVDCDPVHQLIDVEAALAVVAERSPRAVLAVDLFGQCAPLQALADGLAGSDCALVEDAAQSQGATHHGHPIGTLVAAAATSFYPGKNLGAYGDAGAVLTTSAEVAESIRLVGDHGSRTRYVHEVVGVNSRLDTLQAVVLRAKLRRLADWNEQRRASAAWYQQALAGADGIGLPGTADGNEHVWHLFVVRVEERDRVLQALQAEGIGAGVHYAVPIHRQPAFAPLGLDEGAFPQAEAAAREILSLPMFPGLQIDQQERVVEVLRRAVEG